MYFHDKKLMRLVFDHLGGEPGKIDEIMKYRKCGTARAYQIVNELIHYALGYVPRETDRNYRLMRDPNVIAFHINSKRNSSMDPDTPQGFFRMEMDRSYSGHNHLVTDGR